MIPSQSFGLFFLSLKGGGYSLTAWDLRKRKQRDQKTGGQAGPHQASDLFLTRDDIHGHKIQEEVFIILQEKKEACDRPDQAGQNTHQCRQDAGSSIE